MIPARTTLSCMADAKPYTNSKAPVMKKGHTTSGNYGDSPTPKKPVSSNVRDLSLR